MQVKPNPEDNGQITKQFLKRLVKSDFKTYYSTPELNDVLYLHYKGFQKISNLDEYTGLKVLYLEGNAIKEICGLKNLANLRCLYLQENLISKIEGLEVLTTITNLNLTDNMIEKVEGLSTLNKLQNLQLKRNRIGLNGLEDLTGLLQCPSVSALDISANKIQTEEFLPEVLIKMPNIAVVYLQENQFGKKIAHYRKHLITKIPTLKYIDDKPIFEDERRFAIAWERGGLEEERKERALYKQEQEEAQLRQHREFRQMLERNRNQARREKEAERNSSSENQSESREQNLSTYNTPSESHNESQRSSKHEVSEKNSEKEESESEQTKNKEKEEKEQVSSKQKNAYLDELD